MSIVGTEDWQEATSILVAPCPEILGRVKDALPGQAAIAAASGAGIWNTVKLAGEACIGKTIYLWPGDAGELADTADTLRCVHSVTALVLDSACLDRGRIADAIRSAVPWDTITPHNLQTVHAVGLDSPLAGSKPPDVQWYLNGLVPYGSMVLIAGAPKSGKTWLTLDLAVAMALADQRVLGFSIDRPGRVLLYSPEGGKNSLRRRLWGLCRGRGGDPAAVADRIRTINSVRLDLTEESDLLRLGRTVWQYKPSLLVLDTLTKLAPGLDENSKTEVARVLEGVREIMRYQPGMTVVIVHHSTKGGIALRGSSAIDGERDTLLHVKDMNNRDKDRLVLTGHRDAPDTPAFRWRLAFDAAGDEWTQCRLDRVP